MPVPSWLLQLRCPIHDDHDLSRRTRSLYRVHDQKSLAICRDPELVLEEVVITVREQFPGHGRFDFRSGPDLSAHQVSGWPPEKQFLAVFPPHRKTSAPARYLAL